MQKEIEEKIMNLQLMEKNLQTLLIQKQNFQSQLFEIENALKELEGKREHVYKIVGSIMVESTQEDIKKDLSSKKEIVELRIKNIEKQEAKVKEHITEIQTEVMKNLKE